MTQSLTKFWVHIIFSTKKRQPYFMELELQQKIHHYIVGICNNLGFSDVCIGGINNHIHILLLLPKNYSISVVVQKIKSASSKWIKKISGYQFNLSTFQWQSGYGAFSVSHSNVDIVKRYIKNQAEHHKHQSFENELIGLFDRHGVKYDNKYLFEE